MQEVRTREKTCGTGILNFKESWYISFLLANETESLDLQRIV